MHFTGMANRHCVKDIRHEGHRYGMAHSANLFYIDYTVTLVMHIFFVCFKYN